MSSPLVTIGIPTYNRADSFLRTCIESVLNQTYNNIEIIVSDNNSKDNTEEVVLSYNDDRIRYIKQKENLGPIKNTNYCIGAATGAYLQILHDDDMIDPEFIEKCMEAAEYKTDKGIIIAGSREIDEKGNLKYEKRNLCKGLTADEFFIKWYEKELHLFFCSILFNTEKLRALGGFKEDYRFFNDVASEFEMVANYERVDVPEVLASFRAHGGSWGKSTVITEWCKDSFKLLDFTCELLQDKQYEEKLRTIGMATSAERVYRKATSMTDNHLKRFYAYFRVWSEFNFRYFPPRGCIISWMPFTRFLLMPRSSLKLLFKKSNSISSN